MYMKVDKLIVFVDQFARPIIGEIVEESDATLAVKNPAIINVMPDQNNRLNVQTMPYFFPEFIKDTAREEGSVWVFNKSVVATSNITKDNIDERLIEQYTKVFNPSPIATPPGGIVTPDGNPKVVKLFDD